MLTDALKIHCLLFLKQRGELSAMMPGCPSQGCGLILKDTVNMHPSYSFEP